MGHCTIIIIAHRLHTVMQCDRVCVMDGGRVVEFGAPAELLHRPNGSLFADLVNETGPATAAYLRRLAEKSAPVMLSPSRAARSPSSPASPRQGGRGESSTLLDRTRTAMKLLRSSVVELDTPEWAAELQRTNSDGDEWQATPLHMVTSFADLASARLSPPGGLLARRARGRRTLPRGRAARRRHGVADIGLRTQAAAARGWRGGLSGDCPRVGARDYRAFNFV
jgi:hypothetical protein